MPNGADVDVRLIPLKLGLRHLRTPSVRAVRQNADRLSVLFLLLFFFVIRGYSPRFLATISSATARGTCAPSQQQRFVRVRGSYKHVFHTMACCIAVT
jgi:hypothetical protein